VTGQTRFLSVGEVVLIHDDQVRRYGGGSGLRDVSLLESAVAQPAATFEGRDLHLDLIDKAAAYAFHLCRDHPFVDGNKRVALAAALVFLELNGVTINDPKGALCGLMIEVALGRSGRREIADVLRRLRP
jgi:death-on-curing protein